MKEWNKRTDLPEQGKAFYSSETQSMLGKRTFESGKLAIATEAARSPEARLKRSISMSKKKWWNNPLTGQRCRTEYKPSEEWISGRGPNQY